MLVYMVSIYRVTAQKNELGLTCNSRETLGNSLFADKTDAEFFAAACVSQGLDAFVMPKAVVTKEPEIALAS